MVAPPWAFHQPHRIANLLHCRLKIIISCITDLSVAKLTCACQLINGFSWLILYRKPIKRYRYARMFTKTIA